MAGVFRVRRRTTGRRRWMVLFAQAAADLTSQPGVGALTLVGGQVSLGFTIHLPDEL